MDYFITSFLDLADDSCAIKKIYTEGNVKHIEIEKVRVPMVCPVCGCRLYSKGLFRRHPSHQILQDRFKVELTVIGRNWECSNEYCDYTERDTFKFLEKYKKTTNIIPFCILMEMKDINLTCVQIAVRYSVSDTYVHDIFAKWVNLPRLPLTEYLSIDEVYTDLNEECLYALVLQDFITGTILDIIPSRRKEVVEEYMKAIPLEERNRVKYLICDMYDPYINYTKSYFKNSVAITDSFHVLQTINRLIRQYINTVKKRYLDRDKRDLEKKNAKNGTSFNKPKESDEVYLLRKAKWVLLQNEANFVYKGKIWNRHFQMKLDTYDWRRMFMALDPNFHEIKRLRDLYEDFNGSYVNDLDGAAKRLRELIDIYRDSSISIFREFAETLDSHYDTIVNSFTFIKQKGLDENEGVLRRLSNGPMESFNNIPSGLRTQSHGFNNFDFFRNRILWSTREDAAILGTPRTDEEIYHEGKKRGKYNTKSKKQ